jgi:Pyruvate/2-oxoacid:ferredoxin oxidoreductase gamma subunit
VPCNELAAGLGNPRAANIIMLGALIGRTNIMPEKAVKGRIEYAFKKKGGELVKQNYTAFEAGKKAAMEQ